MSMLNIVPTSYECHICFVLFSAISSLFLLLVTFVCTFICMHLFRSASHNFVQDCYIKVTEIMTS